MRTPESFPGEEPQEPNPAARPLIEGTFGQQGQLFPEESYIELPALDESHTLSPTKSLDDLLADAVGVLHEIDWDPQSYFPSCLAVPFRESKEILEYWQRFLGGMSKDQIGIVNGRTLNYFLRTRQEAGDRPVDWEAKITRGGSRTQTNEANIRYYQGLERTLVCHVILELNHPTPLTTMGRDRFLTVRRFQLLLPALATALNESLSADEQFHVPLSNSLTLGDSRVRLVLRPFVKLAGILESEEVMAEVFQGRVSTKWRTDDWWLEPHHLPDRVASFYKALRRAGIEVPVARGGFSSR